MPQKGALDKAASPREAMITEIAATMAMGREATGEAIMVKGGGPMAGEATREATMVNGEGTTRRTGTMTTGADTVMITGMSPQQWEVSPCVTLGCRCIYMQPPK